MERNKNRYKVALEPVLPIASAEVKSDANPKEDQQESGLFSVKHDDLWKSYKDQQSNERETEKISASDNFDGRFNLDDSF